MALGLCEEVDVKKLWFTYLAAVLLAGCTPDAKHPKLDLVECYAHALAPHVGEVFDPVELAKDITSGKSVLAAVAGNLMLTQEEATKLVADLNACRLKVAPPPVVITGS